MTSEDDAPAEMTAAEKLAALVAQKKATGGHGPGGGPPGGRKGSERAAAARSASKSKPVLRK